METGLNMMIELYVFPVEENPKKCITNQMLRNQLSVISAHILTYLSIFVRRPLISHNTKH